MEERIVNLHQVIVHFPVALILAGGLTVLAGLWDRRDVLWKAGQWIMRWGTLAALVALLSGERGEHSAQSLGIVQNLIDRHSDVAYRVVIGLLLYHALVFFKVRTMPERRWGRMGMALFTLLLMAGIAVTGHFGGIVMAGMVYR